MLVTTVLVGIVARQDWKWGLGLTLAVTGLFFVVDAAFFSANVAKILEGGYLPILAGIFIFILMTTWHQGRQAIFERLGQSSVQLDVFWRQLDCDHIPRVPGTAIYLTGRENTVPASLFLNVKHNKCLHETVVLLTVVIERVPRVPQQRRFKVTPLEHGFVRVTISYGFKDSFHVPRTLKRALERGEKLGFKMNGKDVSYFVGRTIPVASDHEDLSAWREPLFIYLAKNSISAAQFFSIPSEQVVELGTHVEI
jgi:KUP system potassium uptake protein